MSADKHTPGPWSVLVHEASTSVESKHYTVAADVTNADADLIAAAPDLLAACDQALVACLPGASDEQRRAAWNACIKAVAKATGGAL